MTSPLLQAYWTAPAVKHSAHGVTAIQQAAPCFPLTGKTPRRAKVGGLGVQLTPCMVPDFSLHVCVLHISILSTSTSKSQLKWLDVKQLLSAVPYPFQHSHVTTHSTPPQPATCWHPFPFCACLLQLARLPSAGTSVPTGPCSSTSHSSTLSLLPLPLHLSCSWLVCAVLVPACAQGLTAAPLTAPAAVGGVHACEGPGPCHTGRARLRSG